MSDPLAPAPRDLKAPGNVSNLQSRITAYARENGLSIARLNQRILTEVTFGLLERARELGTIPMYLAKGGMALELRFGVRARASGDLDLGIVAGGAELLDIFDRALGLGFHDFTFERRGQPERLDNVRTDRLKVKISYRGRAFGTLNIDLNEATFETAVMMQQTGVLTALGLPGPLTVPLLDPYLQIAHKLHGATEPNRADYTNRRHRDLLDVLIMRSDERLALDLVFLRQVVMQEFARRSHHRDWPPLFTLPKAWRDELSRDAQETDFATNDPDELARHFVAFIAEIEGIAVKQSHEYTFLALQMNVDNGDPVDAHARQGLQSFVDEGWKAVYFGPRPGFVDQFLAILERALPEVVPEILPRFQLRVATEYGGNGTVALVGRLRNESTMPGNGVRIFASNVSEVLTIGTVTQGDGDFHVTLPYETAALRTQQPQVAGIVVQYLTDAGVRIEQVGLLRASGPDASGRFTYEGNGLGPSRVIERFTVRHDPLEDP